MAKDSEFTTNDEDISEMDFSDFDSSPVSDLELDWVEANYDELRESFGGEWIAVKVDRVVAHAVRLVDVQNQAEALRIDNPFMTKIAPKDEQSILLEL